MKLTKEQVLRDLASLPAGYKTADVDRLIRSYVKQKSDASQLRPYILGEQKLHRIYYYVSLNQIKTPAERMAFIHENLLFSDWWHTDQIIRYVADLDFDTALGYAWDYVKSEDPFIRRWGYVLFISRLCKGHATQILPLLQNDDAYYVQMAQAWLLAELTIHEPEQVYTWLRQSDLRYAISGKAVQKIIDSYRVPEPWKAAFRALRPELKGKA
jgi:3-methyladenine DNA glycosylase AlkD